MHPILKRALTLFCVLCLFVPAVGLASPVNPGEPYPVLVEVTARPRNTTTPNLFKGDTKLACTVPYDTTEIDVKVTMSPDKYETGEAFEGTKVIIDGHTYDIDATAIASGIPFTGNILYVDIVLAGVEITMESSRAYPLTVTRATKATSQGLEPAPPAPAYEQAKIGNCLEFVNVRSGPGTWYDIIGGIGLGETVALLKWDADGVWCRLFYNDGNNIGWVHGRFIIPQ